MAKCQRIKRKNRRVCIGDLDTPIILQDRDITAPAFGAVDFDEKFNGSEQAWAAVNTVSGKTFFDGVNTDVNITHEIYIRYDASVTAETWVELNGRRLDILDINNLDERDEFLKLTCTDRGVKTAEASKA